MPSLLLAPLSTALLSQAPVQRQRSGSRIPPRHPPRRYGVPEPYEKLKAFTRGQRVTQQSMQEFVANLGDLPDAAREELSQLTPWTYVGNAAQQAQGLAGHL